MGGKFAREEEMENLNYEINQKDNKSPREILFDFTTEILIKYKEKHSLRWKDIEEELKLKTELSSRTLYRFFHPEKTSTSFVMPSIECQFLVISSLRPGLTFEQILNIVPQETREALKVIRLNTKHDVIVSEEFDQFILTEPDAGVLFFLADTNSGVNSTRIKEILGKNGLDLTEVMIKKGFLTLRGSKYYSSNIYPKFNINTKKKIINRMLSSHFGELQKDTNNFSLGLARFDLSLENYIKAKEVVNKAWQEVAELERGESNLNDKQKINCSFFLGLTQLDKNNNNNELTPITLN